MREPLSPSDYAEKLRELARRCPYLRHTSGRRSAEHNAAVGGKPLSKHVLGMADDFVAPTLQELRVAAAAAMGLGLWIEVHDVGSGMHLHVQGLPPGQPSKEWMEAHADYVSGKAVA